MTMEPYSAPFTRMSATETIPMIRAAIEKARGLRSLGFR